MVNLQKTLNKDEPHICELLKKLLDFNGKIKINLESGNLTLGLDVILY